ncbi:uncharacterized protein LOC122015084 [Zingiber officinale]|uniref:uncharacterized protein LOC122015084 n=1 Tax=Zingiber officinale TaxID=94328 RepID=UPI001C4D36B1|nr:uncharacterized protein LOC122015084 [Zingiber officinale]
MTSMEKERIAVKKIKGNGVLAMKKADESIREKKRRLILSDSESDSDDFLVSSIQADRGGAQNGDISVRGEGNEVDPMKEKADVENRKKDLRSDVVKQNEDVAVTDKKGVAEAELARKSMRESADAEFPSTKLKESWELERRKRSLIGGSEVKTSISHTVDDEERINEDEDVGSKTLIPAQRKKGRVIENQALSNSQKNGKLATEKLKLIESSDNERLHMMDRRSNAAGDRRAKIGISRSKDGILMEERKAGVLRVLPSNKKVDGLENHSKRKYEDISKDINASSVATYGAVKQPSLSHCRRFDGNSSLGATVSRNETRKPKKDVLEKSEFSEPETEQKIVSPKRETKDRTDISKSETGLRTKSSCRAGTSFKTKQFSKDATVSRSTEKQKLRDQIKGILLNAGWTIDLRPRRGRKYEDSVYIPPEGHGGYWSITKAYAVYQERLNRKGNVEGEISRGGNSRTSSTCNSIVPLESLDLLKRVVVNKRRRAEESEEDEKNKRNKVKRKYDKRHFIDQDTKGKLASNSMFSVSTTSRKNLHQRRSKQRGRALLVRGSNQESEADDDDYVPYVWKRTVLSWMIDMGVLPINGKVKYMNQLKTKTKLKGQITRQGINCSCCSKSFPVSKFELHAGSRVVQLQPMQNIFLEDGETSLFNCQIEAWKKQDESERRGFYTIDVTGDDPNDDTCGICSDGGSLICCDGCPSTFHLSCLGIEKLPPGDWHCTNCCCRYCGRISTDPSGESDATVSLILSCHQCEAKYHEDCIPDKESISATSKKSTISFCGQSCRKIFRGLQKILGTKNEIEAGFSWSIVRRFDEDSSISPIRSRQMVECNSMIAVSLAVMDECFLPIVDQRSGINLIHNVVYNCGSNFSRLNYRGFYTFILERKDEIISVASVRIHGTRLAEMPFIGTRNMYRRQGMCRRLLSGIESALSSLNVEKLIIPAISELKDTWINAFGFKPLEPSEKLEVRSINILVFPGTGSLQKPLLKNHSSKYYNSPTDGVGVFEHVIKHHYETKAACDSSDLSAAEANLPNLVKTMNDCRNKAEYEGENLLPSRISDESADSNIRYSLKNADVVCTNTSLEECSTSSHDEDKSQMDLTSDKKTGLIGITSDNMEKK